MSDVLVVGSGGREHAYAWKLSQSERINRIFVSPGNAGTASTSKCENVSIDTKNGFDNVTDFVKNNGIDLTVIGPEDPLEQGIVNLFEESGLAVFGPTKEAARFETSKVWSKDFMKRNGIPTADYKVFTDYQEALEYVLSSDNQYFVKEDGLCLGKGAMPARTRGEKMEALKALMVDKKCGQERGKKVVVEDCLEGEEATILAFVNSEKNIVRPLLASQDHKPVFDGDKGPNTGGMGAYCPAPIVNEYFYEKICNEIIWPTVAGMRKEGVKYKGILYFGLMINKKTNDVRVLEYNVRGGDPEVQPTLMLLETDLYDLMEDVVYGKHEASIVGYKDGAAVCVVMASGGYPSSYEKGKRIEGLESVSGDDVYVFHAGTKKLENGDIVTNGGRVLGVTACGSDIRDAQRKAYDAIGKIRFESAHYRRDIAKKSLVGV